MKHVALLRGINVGGKNMVPMSLLAELFEGAGCDQVQTYIQSGNVVFCAKSPDKACGSVSKGLAKRLKIEVPVVMRTATEIRRVVEGNPFTSAADGTLHVAFLADEPTKAQVAALDPQRSPGDTFIVRGRDVYLHLPNGAARTKLTNAWLDSRLDTISTGRNWRTVLKLLEMVSK